MSELFLDPTGFDSQTDTFVSASESAKAVSYSCDAGSAELASVERYVECITEFNNTVKEFGLLLDSDATALREIKAQWMNTDNAIANYTIGEVALKGFKVLFGLDEE